MSDLKVKGKIVKILEVEKGTSKAGKEWSKQNFVIDNGNQYNPEICFQIFGEEKIENFKKFQSVGDEVEVSFYVSSREFKDKYYHNLDAWMIKDIGATTSVVESSNNDDGDDLPF